MELPVNQIVCGDSINVMDDWPDGCIDTVITDPMWPGQKPEMWDGVDVYETFRKAAEIMNRITKRIVVVLGSFCNPDILSPIKLPFMRVCYLRYARPNYVGRFLAGADIAYVYGSLPIRKPGRLLVAGYPKPAECVRTDNKGKLTEHPAERPLQHMDWLVRTFADDIILDPFCGSGTTCIAAIKNKLPYIGIDINPDYCKISEERIKAAENGLTYQEAKAGQGGLFDEELLKQKLKG